MPGRIVIRRLAPAVVSASILAFLLMRMDLAQVGGALTWDAGLRLAPILIVYLGVSLALEAVSLVRLVPSSGGSLDTPTAARVKAASYLLGVLHYALGAGALAVLLRRRAGVSLAAATGVVMGISVADLIVLLLSVVLGATLVVTGAPPVRASVGLVVGGGFALGLYLLRTSRNLGPLEGLRSLELFRALRTVPAERLAELFGLRGLFVLAFVGVLGLSMACFGIRVPLTQLVVGICLTALVATLPIAVAGLGTSQMAFVYFFQGHAAEETLLACSLVVSASFIVLRSGIGLAFAREYAREAAREVAIP